MVFQNGAKSIKTAGRDICKKYGGAGGIRTHVGVAPLHAFQACSINRSDTAPQEARDWNFYGSRVLKLFENYTALVRGRKSARNYGARGAVFSGARAVLPSKLPASIG